MVLIKKLRSQLKFPCDSCSGTGAKKGTQPKVCPTCKGAGQVRMQHGFIAVQQACRDCRGAGKVIEQPCADCHGQGRKQKTKTLSIKVPAGVDNGDRIRLAGEGEAGQHGAPGGDLYVQLYLQEHPIFKREGSDLYCEAPISIMHACLGGEIDIPTIDGQVKLTIPEGTQSGKLFRLRGKGIKTLHSHQTGDLLCRVCMETPIKLSDEQKEYLTKLDESLKNDSKNHSPKSKNWFESVKEFFKS